MLLEQSGRIGALRLKNRVVMAPMGTNYSTTDGLSTERDKLYYAERARGGVAMIMTEAMVVTEHARPHHNSLCCYHDRFIPGLAELARRVHAHDGRIALQLVHGGKSSMQDIGAKRPVFLPSVPTEQAPPDPLGAFNTPEEIGAMSGVPTATVRTRIFYGLRAARKILHERGILEETR